MSNLEPIYLLHSCMLSPFSRVQIFATLRIIAYWAPLPWDSPPKNIWVGCHFLLQGPSLPRDRTCICRHVLYHISYINIIAFQSSELEPVKQQLTGIYHFCYFSLLKFTDTVSAPHMKLITRKKEQITGWEIGNTLFWFGRTHSTPS